jgi:hypothetical protein
MKIMVLQRGMLIGGDLDVDEEGFEQNERTLVITAPRLHWISICAHTNWPHQEGLSLSFL